MVAFLCVNLLVFVLELIGLRTVYGEVGESWLIYYTQLSNLPMWAWRIFHAAVSATTVTFLVVLLVLSWMYGDLWYVLTAGSMLYTHSLCPLMALGAFVGFAPKRFKKMDAIRATSFTAIYGLVTIVLNATRVMKGPYPFLYVYEQPIWATVFWAVTIIGGAYVLSRLILVRKIEK